MEQVMEKPKIKKTKNQQNKQLESKEIKENNEETKISNQPIRVDINVTAESTSRDVKTIERDFEEEIKPEVKIENSPNHKTLSNEISNEVVEEVKETTKFNNLLLTNQKIEREINKEQLNDCLTKMETKVKTKIKEVVINTIKPYTESQLAALYTNSELEMLEQFTLQYVEAELKGLSVKQHPLYELLSNYVKVREKITENSLELKQLRDEYDDMLQKLWSLDTCTASGRAQCNDGNVVTATHLYQKATFHRSTFKSVVRILSNIRKITYENHVLYSYSAEDLRLQIELYVQTAVSNCVNISKLDKNSPIMLSLQNEPIHLKPYLCEIRLCISILFAFQRKLIRDAQFIKEIKDWLSRLVAVLLRLATYQDHLFILNHVLRCPAGVASWASSFIQTPLDDNIQESPFSSYQINHILSILCLILTPVAQRDKFLEDIVQSKENNGETLWIMVDSEGEEDEISGNSFRENDLVALLSQLPLHKLFRALLLVERKDYQNSYTHKNLSEHHLLRFFAFGTVFLKIIYKGLQTYNQPRYNQFLKRLSRLIRHIVQYGTDQWEVFKKFKKIDDSAMLDRLQVEYDSFFLRAIYYLYTSQKLGGWQFLAVVPYDLITIRTVWKIFYFLHNSDQSAHEILNPVDNIDYSKNIWDKSLRSQFEDKLSILADDESYYLLNTFANMALARSEDDMEFIKMATMDLLQIGFVSEATHEMCSKTARTLLTHLTSKYPHMLSDILKLVKDNIKQTDSPILYLYEELPLSVWNFNEDDLEIISKLLINNPFNTNETKLARMILSRLNWDILPYKLHCDVAILVLQVVDQEPAYTQWGWQTVLRLKLHISDKLFTDIGKVFEPDKYDIIVKGVRLQQSLPCFVAVLLTTWGHLIPLICSHGLPLVLLIQTYQKHEAALFALYLIVPLFVNCQEYLINCEQFQQIISNLINADRGYISMAKSLISAQNTVLQQFGNMIETQIANFAYYDLPSPRCLVRLWANSLVSVPNWNRDNGILYLLDVIIKAAFFHGDALEAVNAVLKELLQNNIQEQTSTIGSIFKWVSSSPTNASFIPNSLSSYSWLAYIVLEIECDERENRTGLWRELLNQLNMQKGKVNVDAALKKSCNTLKIPLVTSASLCIYRWAQQAMDTPVDHPILPILWQKFFLLYLARIPVATTIDKGCVSDKFFDGLVNFTFLKKIKKRLQECVDYYQSKVDNKESDEEFLVTQFNENNLKLFKAFSLWLEETRLQETNIFLPSLPTQYQPNLLAFIIQSSHTPWFEYVNYTKMKTEQLDCIKIWKISNFRYKSNVNKPLSNPGSTMESDDPVERILRRLNVYENPKDPPEIKIVAPIVPAIDFSNTDTMFKSLEPYFKTLKQFAQNHALKLSEHIALDCSYLELVPQMYRSVLQKINKKAPCKGKNQTVNCSGAAVIVLEMQEAKLNSRIDHQIQTNRNAHESLINECLQAPALSLCIASITIQQAIKMLQSQLRCYPASAALGTELFYYILSLLNEETNSYLPTKTLIATCLQKLGQSHIYGVEFEMPRLLERILKEPSLGGHLAPHFSPSKVGTANLLFMYSKICQEIGEKYDVTFALLSKFDIIYWLKHKCPKLSQRTEFIQAVIKALTMLGFEPPVESLMLHGLYRKHLLTIFEFQFPEHYGEILMFLLKASNGSADTALIATNVWMDVINSISKPTTINLKLSLREQLRQYAQNQRMLQHQELVETADLFTRHFTQERLQYGIFGLYPKCRNYIDIYVFLFGMTGHGLIVSMINTHQGMLGDCLCEKIWPYIRNLFTPWIVPYSMQNLQENMAAWIQQLADDRSVLLPWIPADEILAQKMVNVFYECVQFILHTLPASRNILNFLWQWYVSSFAHVSVKEHILKPIHNCFVAFPWHNFWPTVADLELMLRVVDQYLPECHSFLGHIFMSIPWQNWLSNFTNTSLANKSRVYQCFINLLIKLSNEPNVRNKYPIKMKVLLVEAEDFDWSVLESSVFQHVMNWYVLSCDSLVIFKSDPIDLDFRIFNFLKTVSGYDKPNQSPNNEVLNKRLIYVKSYIKLVSVFTSRYKNVLSSKESELKSVINQQLSQLETNVLSEEELNSLLYEYLSLLNIHSICHISSKCFDQWVKNKPGNSLIIKSLLQTLGICVCDFETVAELLELTITCYFQNNVSEFETSWSEIRDTLKIVVVKQSELEQIIVNKGHILVLNAILLKKIERCHDTEVLLNLALEWIANIKMNETNESKIPLLWLSILQLSLTHCEKDEPSTGSILYKFSKILAQISESKENSGWGRGLLSVIGINKQSTISIKFLCRALAAYILAQLPDMKGEAQTVRHEANAPAKVGQPGGNIECVKLLLNLGFGQSQGKIKECEEFALKQIQDPNNSLHNSQQFLILLVKQFYLKPYLKEIC